jgi:hypothetical protein
MIEILQGAARHQRWNCIKMCNVRASTWLGTQLHTIWALCRERARRAERLFRLLYETSRAHPRAHNKENIGGMVAKKEEEQNSFCMWVTTYMMELSHHTSPPPVLCEKCFDTWNCFSLRAAVGRPWWGTTPHTNLHHDIKIEMFITHHGKMKLVFKRCPCMCADIT